VFALKLGDAREEVEHSKELAAQRGKQEIPEVPMTRKEDSSEDSIYSQCPCFQITNCIQTKGNSRQLHTIEEILGLDDDLIAKNDYLGNQNMQEDMDNNKLRDSTVSRKTVSDDFIPVEIPHKPEQENKFGVVITNEDSSYVSLNLHMLKRAKSEGRITKKKQKPNCYFRKKEEDNDRVVLRRAKSADVPRKPNHDQAGISESTVFFSSIGEWTVIDLNLQVFETEDAKRTFYLRRKGASYKEVEPENVCRLL